MLVAALVNLGLALWVPHTALTIILPVVVYATGMSLAMPNLSLLALEVFPAHLGLASALQGFGQAGFNAAVAGVLAPLLSGQVQFLASGMLLLNMTGFALWVLWCNRRNVRESVSALS